MAKRKEKDIESEIISKEMEEYINDKTAAMLRQNNDIQIKQKQLEQFESQKAKMTRDNEENTSNRLKKTSEHGQILMTINNMFERVTLKGNALIAQNPLKDKGPLKDFNNESGEVEKIAEIQLGIIKEFIENFQTFQQRLNKVDE